MKRIQSSAFRLEYTRLTEPHEVVRYGEVIGVYHPVTGTGYRSHPDEQGREQRAEEAPSLAPAFALPPRPAEPSTLDSFRAWRKRA